MRSGFPTPTLRPGAYVRTSHAWTAITDLPSQHHEHPSLPLGWNYDGNFGSHREVEYRRYRGKDAKCVRHENGVGGTFGCTQEHQQEIA